MAIDSLLLRSTQDGPSVAIVVPRYKSSLDADEQISLRHLRHFLNGYDTYFVSPQSLNIENAEFPIKRFDDSYFAGILSYSRLMLSQHFYDAFADWDYILIYQLDCLVFSDQLSQWCERGYDYIGAPWLVSIPDPEKGFSMVGNGGFSLRKISSFLKVIENAMKLSEVMRNARRLAKGSKPLITQNSFWWLMWLCYNHPQWYRNHEDWFWSKCADKHYADFRVPPVDVALSFGFECAPEYCFERNNHQLPFGCHAWAKHNRAFWEPYLLSKPLT